MISVQSLTPFQIALLVSTSNEWPSQCLRNWVPLGYTTKAISETISAALQHAALDTRWPWPTWQYLWRGWHRDTESSRGLRARRLPSLNHLVVTGFRQGLRYIRWFQWAEHAFPFFIYIGVLFYMFSSYENIFEIVSLKVKPMWFNCLFTREHMDLTSWVFLRDIFIQFYVLVCTYVDTSMFNL